MLIIIIKHSTNRPASIKKRHWPLNILVLTEQTFGIK
jgi:hypothetical protein